MSEIGFFDELGDRLERAASAELHRRRPRRWRLPRGRARAAALAVVLLGGGVAAAAAVLESNTTTLAATGLVCHSGTDPHNSPAVIFASLWTPEGYADGGSPTEACAGQFAALGYGRRSAGSLIACASQRYGIEVYKRDGRAAQCSRLGLHPMPGGYRAAAARIFTLEAALSKLYYSANCLAPDRFDAGVSAILDRQGFGGWRLRHLPAQFGGRCGQFPSTAPDFSNSTPGFYPEAFIDGSAQTVAVTTGPPQSVTRISLLVTASLSQHAATRCFTVPELERRVRARIVAQAGQPASVDFAVFHKAREMSFGPPGQRLYDRGCAMFLWVAPGTSSSFSVTVLQRDAPREQPGFKFEERGP